MSDIIKLKEYAIIGDLQASNTLAVLYEHGVDVEQSYEQAAVWWLNAFSLGNVSALDCWRRCMMKTGKEFDEVLFPDFKSLEMALVKCLIELLK